MAKEFPAQARVDVAPDAFASFGRFCDADNLFGVLINTEMITKHDKQCWLRRFPASTPQPQAFVVGQLRIVFIANGSNAIRSVDAAAIRKAVSAYGTCNVVRASDRPESGYRVCDILRWGECGRNCREERAYYALVREPIPRECAAGGYESRAGFSPRCHRHRRW
jgi:hypothetical protein